MPPVPGRGAGGSARGKAKPKGGRGKASANVPSRSLTPAATEVAAAPVILEEVWVQCDACQKWRRLPPGTIIGDDDPWYCSLNLDTAKNNCDAPEESYDADKEVVIASSDPFYSNLVPRCRDTKKELLVKAGYLPEAPAPSPATLPKSASQPKAKKATDSGKKQSAGASGKAEPGSSRGAQSLADELNNLIKACQQLVHNSGSWEPSASGQPTLVSPPPWVWHQLSILVPEAAQEAAAAVDMLSAARYLPKAVQPVGQSAPHDPGIPSPPPPTAQPQHMHDRDTIQGQLDSLARLAIITAAALAIPAAEASLGQLASSQNKSSKGTAKTPAPAAATSAQPAGIAFTPGVAMQQVGSTPVAVPQPQGVQGWVQGVVDPSGSGQLAPGVAAGGGSVLMPSPQQQPGLSMPSVAVPVLSPVQGLALQPDGSGMLPSLPMGGSQQAQIQGIGAVQGLGSPVGLQQQWLNMNMMGAGDMQQAQQQAGGFPMNGMNANAAMLQFQMQQMQQAQMKQQQMQGTLGGQAFQQLPIQQQAMQQFMGQLSPTQQQQLALQQSMMAVAGQGGVVTGNGQPPQCMGGNPGS